MFLLCENKSARTRHQTAGVTLRTIRRLLKDVKITASALERNDPSWSPKMIQLGRTDIWIWRAPSLGPNGPSTEISIGSLSFSLMPRLRRG